MTENVTDLPRTMKFRKEMLNVNMVVLHRPQNPVINGKNRWKFPSLKDCCVRVGIFTIDKEKIGEKKAVRVYYDQQGNISKSGKRNGAIFVLEVSCITRHAIDERSLIDVPLHMVCLQRPLNWRNFKQYTHDDIGFWFRFFGRSCRFHIRISLKIHLGKRGKCAQDKVINTVELDIVNREIISHKNFSGVREKPSRETSLYSEKGYQLIMEELQTLQENCLWEKCKSAGDRLLSGSDQTNADYKICILLEQSKVACQLGKLKDAKSLVKKALEIIPKSQNKALLTGRAYTCLSLSHQYAMAFGNAEECLRIAKTSLSDFTPCEDTGDCYYQEGRVLIGFIFRLANLHIELINEAKDRIEMAIIHFRKSNNWKCASITNKIYSGQMYIAMLLLANKEDDSIAIADQLISSMAEIYFLLSNQSKCKFSFAKALLMEQNGNIKGALVNGKAALDLANTSGLHLEKQWIDNFLRRLQRKQNETCCIPHSVVTHFASDFQSIYEADCSSDT